MKKLVLLPLSFFVFQASAQDGVSTTQASSSTLPSIVVSTATMTEQSIAEAPASVTVITADDIAKQPVHNITDVLKYSEGVMVTGSNDKGISLRGFDSSYTLILVNGKRLSSRSLSVRHNADADLSWINPQDIERIEIIRGPMATLYGAEAIGGVVNIITKPISNKWRSSLQANIMSYDDKNEKDQTQYQMSVAGPLLKDRLQVRLGGSFSGQDRPTFPSTDMRQYSGHEDTAFNTELQYVINQFNNLSFEYGKNFEKQKSRFSNNPTQTEVERTHISASHYYRGTNLSTDLVAFVDSYDYDDNGKPAKLENRTVQGQVKGSVAGRHLLVGGFELQNNVLENKAQLTTGDAKSDLNAVFIEDSYQASESNTITAGVRQTHHDKFGPQLSPRVFLVHAINENLNFKTGVGTGFKTPTLLQLSKDFHLPSCKGACTMVGNPDLKPEKSISYEMGLTYTQESLFLNASIFYSELSDMITTYFETIGGVDYRLLHNVEKARTQGIEFGSRWAFAPRATVGFNFTLTEGKNLSQDKYLSNLPDAVANLQLDYALTQSVSTYGILSHVGHRNIDDNTGFRTAPGYQTVNLGFNYDLPKWDAMKAQVSAGVENLTDYTLDARYGFGEPGRRYFLKFAVSQM